MFSCYSLCISHPFLPTPTPRPQVCSLLLPCRKLHQYHLSRFHIYVLVYDISLSDFSSLCIIGSRLLKRKGKDTEAGDNREEGRAKTRAEIGMIQLQDKEHLWLLRASGSWEEARKDSPLEPRPFSGCRFCWHPDFRLLASRAVREYN